MRSKVLYFAITALLFFPVTLITEAQIEKNLAGNWKFEAPNAPHGSTDGLIIISADTVMMVFPDSPKFPSDWVRVKGDSIIWETTFEKDKVKFMLKVMDDQNMNGKAVWDEGETPVMLRRQGT